jgi:type IV pilus assembly protein PilE
MGGNMRQARGFTLIELLITVVVLGILAAIALPSYTSYITRSKLTEAHSQLSDLRVKLEQRFQDARSYANCGTIVAAATGTKYFDYTCPAVADPVNTFIIQAAGKAGTELEGIAFTVTESNARATTVTGGSKMATKGFTSNTGCWVTKKPNQC